MPLTAIEVMPLVLAAMPSFRTKWEDDVKEFGDEPEAPGGRLGYLDAADAVRHAVGLLAAGDPAQVRALLAVVERLHREGDDYVQELATIGYLEAFQNELDRHAHLTRADLLPLLGPESRRWWDALDRFWSGEAPVVRVDPPD